MRTTFAITLCAFLIVLTSCGGQTEGNGNAPGNVNSNKPALVASANDQTSTGNPKPDAGPTEAQRQLQDYVKQFLAKPIPQKLSSAPHYQEKVAAFRKEGDNYVFLPPTNPTLAYLAPYYTESSADLKTIILLDPGNTTFSVIDTTLPAVVVKKKVNIPRSDSEQDAEYKFIIEFSKMTYSIADALKK